MKNEAKTSIKKEEKASLHIEEHPVFKGDMKTEITTSIDMANLVSSIFAGVFADYYGCNVRINDGTGYPAVVNSMPQGSIYVDLFFKDMGTAPENLMKNIELINGGGNKESKDPLGARFARVNGSANGRVYNVTASTYQSLEKFMRSGERTRWAEHTYEISSTMSPYGKEEALVCISGLDLNKLVTEIYGNDLAEGKYEYAVTPSTIIPGKNQEFIMQICQLNLKTVRDLQSTLGIYAPSAPQFHQYSR